MCRIWENLERKAVSKLVCQISFWRFFTDRSVEVDEIHIKAIIDSDHHSTTREIAEKLDVSHTCTEKRLKQFGYVRKLDLRVPHQLKEIHLTQRISICDSLLKRNEIDPFLKRLITGDQKWIVYNNVNGKRSWMMEDEPAQTTPKAETHRKKIMLSVWRDYKGILYFELLPRNQTINSNVYIQQLAKLSDAVEGKLPEVANRKGVVFQHDDAKPHTSLVTRQKLLKLRLAI